jgi:hypothetical protein
MTTKQSITSSTENDEPLESKNEDELRDLYESCDVSNNGTENPIGFDEFKRQIQELIAKARINELEAFIKSMSHYQTDHAYEHEPFYTVTDTDLKDRINELQALQTKKDK